MSASFSAETFDYVIVGAGAAGSVIANRLSENPDLQILLLEAGGSEITSAVESPHRWNEVLLTELDWAYMGEPQPGLAERQVYSASGQGLGGTSNVYHMIHTRGRAADYDNWAYQGAAGWSFQEVLPYFQKLEDQADDTNPTAGKGGPIHVMNAKAMGSPVSQSFIDACVELGYPLVEDFNREDDAQSGFGVGWHHVDIKDGKRCGVRTGYLEPAMRRPNVTVRSHCLAGRLLFAGNRCVGVEYRQDGVVKSVHASQEVVLCAGAIQTPKLLLLSGIGNPEQLEQFDIPVLLDLPGVGENFHDHPLVIGPIGLMSKPGPDPQGNVTEVALFWGSEAGLAVPDLEICLVHRAPFGEAFFANVIKRVQTGQPVAPVKELVDPRIILALPGLVRPLSRGWVRLASSDPAIYPKVSANYFGEKADLDRTVQMVQMTREIYATNSFAKAWGLMELSPGSKVNSYEALEEWVINNVGSYYHFVGSCKMGIDRMAVVDSRLKVHGLDGLRIVDASIMPAVPSANPHTAVVMIGERAADFIKEELSSTPVARQQAVLAV
ncbi:MAG: GMC family oxidoreductase N-terminal domain-containing protein [Caldilineaceae bacterium]